MDSDSNNSSLSGWGLYPSVPTHSQEYRGSLTEEIEENSIARGLGRSYADQAVAENGSTLFTANFNRVLAFNETTGILTCQSGLSLQHLIEITSPKGWFPSVCPGTKFITIGGAIANDIHGKGHHSTGSFFNSVISFTLRTASGDMLTANRKENADIFQACFGGLGLLGIIHEVTLQLEKIETNWFSQQPKRFSSIEECFSLIDEFDAIYDYSVGWINTTSKSNSGVITFGNRAKASELKSGQDPFEIAPDPKISVPFKFPVSPLNRVTVSSLNQVLKFLQTRKEGLVHYDPFFFPLDMVANWNRGYGKKGFFQYQFVLPKETGLSGINQILADTKEAGFIPFLNVIKKFGKGNDCWLSFPFEGYTLALDFPASTKLLSFLKTLDLKVLALGGRTYLAKDAILNADNFRAMYPKSGEWFTLKKQIDPKCVFSSAIGKRLKLCNY